MKKLVCYAFAIAAIGTSATTSVPALADSQSKDVFCNRNSTISISEYPKGEIPDGYGDVQTYVMDSDFRSPKNDIPWSETKIFDDPVTGKSIAVIDRNYIPDSHRVHTYWGRDLITAEGIEIFRYTAARYTFDVMMIPSGDKYLALRGCNGRFPVNQKVANALTSMPVGKKVFIKLYTSSFSGAVLNEIGPGTVKAWKKIYANWSRSTAPKPDELGF